MLITRNKRQTYMIPDNLIHSAGSIIATFGTTSYTTALPALTASTLYFCYLLSGVMTIVTSTPSAYRASNPSAILIGALYSNGITGSVAFGCFVNIEGCPTTHKIPFTSTFAGGVYANEGTWFKRDGKYLYADIGFTVTSTTANPFSASIPFNLDSTEFSATTAANILGGAIRQSGTQTEAFPTVTFGPFIVHMDSAASLNLLYCAQDVAGSQFVKDDGSELWVAAGRGRVVAYEIPIASWSNTPLKDL